jgi:hypothetical protein
MPTGIGLWGMALEAPHWRGLPLRREVGWLHDDLVDKIRDGRAAADVAAMLRQGRRCAGGRG